VAGATARRRVHQTVAILLLISMVLLKNYHIAHVHGISGDLTEQLLLVAHDVPVVVQPAERFIC
jgi:hypothetical protein